jgi:hypothetical protein
MELSQGDYFLEDFLLNREKEILREKENFFLERRKNNDFKLIKSLDKSVRIDDYYLEGRKPLLDCIRTLVFPSFRCNVICNDDKSLYECVGLETDKMLVMLNEPNKFTTSFILKKYDMDLIKRVYNYMSQFFIDDPPLITTNGKIVSFLWETPTVFIGELTNKINTINSDLKLITGIPNLIIPNEINEHVIYVPTFLRRIFTKGFYERPFVELSLIHGYTGWNKISIEYDKSIKVNVTTKSITNEAAMYIRDHPPDGIHCKKYFEEYKRTCVTNCIGKIKFYELIRNSGYKTTRSGKSPEMWILK